MTIPANPAVNPSLQFNDKDDDLRIADSVPDDVAQSLMRGRSQSLPKMKPGTKKTPAQQITPYSDDRPCWLGRSTIDQLDRVFFQYAVYLEYYRRIQDDPPALLNPRGRQIFMEVWQEELRRWGKL